MKRASLTSGKECILVVDDDPAMLEYTQALLASEPYRIELAANAAQAVQLLQHGLAPDLFSCLSQPDVIVQALRHGALDFITKPFSARVVTEPVAGMRSTHA